MKLHGIHSVRVFVGAVLCLYAAGGCRGTSDNYSLDDFRKVKKIDAHVHDNADSSTFVGVAADNGFRILSVNVDYPDFPPMEAQQRTAEAHCRAYPNTFAYAATVSVAGWDSSDWAGKAVSHLDTALARGAIAVKFWKNIGMVLKDNHGTMVMLDDGKLDPVFSHLSGKGIPVISHCGEPRDCWLPVAEMMSNDMKEYFSHHPQYHMNLQPDMPSYDDQILARNRMLEKNPALRVVGAHLGSMEWSVDTIAAFLDTYPKASVDMAARMDYLQLQSQKDWQKVHDFLCKYRERILYGTDLIINPADDPSVFTVQARNKWLSDWEYLATHSTMTVPNVAGTVKGLALPKDVIDKLYRENAESIFGGAWTPTQ
jgi:predicted TIM-barrel fold metal-dependent hydrolase